MASISSGKSLLLLFLLQASLVAFLAGAASILEIGNAVGVSRQREFDYFAFAQQWPATYCRGTRHCCSKNACCWGDNSPTEFTIHGLWPDYNDGSWPSCCYRSDFDEKEITTLIDDLKKYWPTLSCSSPSTCHGGRGSFWGHEWEKHGTCSSPVIRDEYSYFITTLNLYFKYNVTSVLYEAGYVPSDDEKYPLGGIVSAIQNAFHTTPKVVCKRGAIDEIHICFYKDFKTRDCAASYSCPKYVSLPAYTSSGHGNAEGRVLQMPGDEAI